MILRQSIVFQLFMLFTPICMWQCEQPPTTNAAPIVVDKNPAIAQADSIVLDKNPEFKGGVKALFKYLSDNVKYPPFKREKGIEGTVYIHFMVETDGQVTNVKVARGIGGGCNEEAVRVVKSMSGMWESGLNQGVKVRMSFSLPVKFKLE